MTVLKRKCVVLFYLLLSIEEERLSCPLSSMIFSSANKYSGVVFESGNFVLGAPEFVLGNSYENYREKIEEYFTVTEVGKEAYRPQEKHTFGMYLDSNWYELRLKEEWFTDDPVKSLDVSILQDYLLDPVLGIHDPKTDDRIDFIGGIRGLKELERRADSDMRVSFSLYPTNISELLAVADADRLMPPKSTWFEPKPADGPISNPADEAAGAVCDRKCA